MLYCLSLSLVEGTQNNLLRHLGSHFFNLILKENDSIHGLSHSRRGVWTNTQLLSKQFPTALVLSFSEK